MKKVIICLNILALIFSVIWWVKSDWQLEPLITSIAFVGTLLGAIFIDDIKKIVQVGLHNVKSEEEINTGKITQRSKGNVSEQIGVQDVESKKSITIDDIEQTNG